MMLNTLKRVNLINLININIIKLLKTICFNDTDLLEDISTNKRDLNIFIIDFTKLGGFLQMKIDEYLFKNFDYFNNYLNDILLIRFYQFSNNTITIGKLQKINEEIIKENKEYLIVRRITGGKAVYHIPKKDLTFSVIANTNIFKKINFNNENILNFIHKFFNNLVKETLFSLNINLNKSDTLNKENKDILNERLMRFDCFAKPMDFELVYNNQKIVGTAIKIDNTKFILQANIKLYLINESIINQEFIDKFIQIFYINLYKNFSENLANISNSFLSSIK